MFAESSSPSASPAKEETKKKSGEIRFDMPKSFTNTANQTKDFPTMEEAGKPKKGAEKKTAEKPAAQENPAAEAAVTEVPRFTNTKKKDDKPAFAKLEEQKEHNHEGELISAPYSGAGPREFKVAGEEKKKEFKPYHRGPHKEWKQHDAPKDAAKEGPKREQPYPKKAPAKAEEQKDKKAPAAAAAAKKAGDKVAAFAVDAPAGV